MSAKRYRMALEAILVCSQMDAHAIARRALEGGAVKAAAPESIATVGVRHDTVTRPLTMPAPPAATVAAGDGHRPESDDEPEPIDLAAIDAELDAETPPERSGVGEGADGGAAQAGERNAAPSAPPPAPAVGAPPRAARTSRPAARNARERIIKALRERGEATAAQLVARTGLSPSTCFDCLKALEAEGQIVTVGIQRRPKDTPGRGSRIYSLLEPMDAKVAQLGTRGKGRGGPGNDSVSRRAEVLTCIREGAGLLDEREIALQLEMDREHVAEATGALLEDGQVVLAPDGTYSVAESEAA